MDWNRLLVKLDRIFAWVLLATFVFYFISGYGITKNIVNAQFSYNLHTIYLPIVILIAFVGHTSYAVHLAFKRWRIWNGFTKFLLVAFYAAFLIFFLFIQSFYKPNSNSQTNTTPATSDDNSLGTSSSSQPAGSTSTQSVPTKTFTLSELSKHDGQNGNQAYVAVDGTVYDVTAVFIEGRHFSHLAGSELTNAFYTRHAKSAIIKYPAVGKLI